jgi:hypothetical protein
VGVRWDARLFLPPSRPDFTTQLDGTDDAIVAGLLLLNGNNIDVDFELSPPPLAMCNVKVFTAAPFWFTRQQQRYIAAIPSQQ